MSSPPPPPPKDGKLTHIVQYVREKILYIVVRKV